MGLFRKKKIEKKEEKDKPILSVDDVKKLIVLFGHVKLASAEDSDAAKLYELLNNEKIRKEEILEVWNTVMKRGDRVYRIADVGFEFRKLADVIRFDNKGRPIKGKDVYAIVGGTTEKIYAEYGVGMKELTGKAPEYPYTGNGFTPNGDGMILPELYLTKSYKPFFIYVDKIKGNGESEGAQVIMLM
ncbi:MAG: hypothetical protein GXO25_05625 [Euryarchaeota archaeon]|nr:hypothetical protein [Euryarchaeota archaeon]